MLLRLPVLNEEPEARLAHRGHRLSAGARRAQAGGQILIMGPLIKRRTGKNVQMLIVPQNRDDLIAITELIEAGKVRTVIDKTYSFDEIPEAMRHVSEGHAKGKVVITVG